jgi:hypothetical protein
VEPSRAATLKLYTEAPEMKSILRATKANLIIKY